MKKLFYRLLVKLGFLTQDTYIWVLCYTDKQNEGIQVQYFFSELEAVNCKQKVLANDPSTAVILSKYSGVDPKQPITFEGSL